MTSRCGHRWFAPYLPPPTREQVLGIDPEPSRVLYREVECAEPAGHEGPHRTLTNCIKEKA